MAKLLLVAGPLAIYAVSIIARTALGRRPSRQALNVEVAVLLSLYFLATAALGIFWVQNQQLPPFDLHYLCGYATLLLVLIHLAYNARIVIAHARRGGAPTAKRAVGAGLWGKVAAGLSIAGVAFYMGMRAGTTELPEIPQGTQAAHAAATESYHAMSTHTRSGVVARAPSVAWDLPVAPLDRSRLPRVDLPVPDPARGTPRSLDDALAGKPIARETPIDLDDLSQLLWATAGITDRRGGVALRASASSGALFPTEVYVLAFDVVGLSPGTYAFGPDERALFDLGRAPPLSAAIGLAGTTRPALALVTTSVFRRTGQKYRDRAYRYVVADAGHVVGNAIVAAGELGLSTRLAPRFDEGALARLLGLDDESEGVVAVMRMTAGPEVAAPVDAALFAPATMTDAETLELGATAWVHRATSLSFLEPEPTAPHHLELPRAQVPEGRAFALIAARRSQRSFTENPLPAAELGAVLRLATGHAPAASSATRVRVVANRVDGVLSGAHRYLVGAHALETSRTGDLAREVGRAGLDQEVVADAPAVVVITADRRALAAEGARGYRHAFLEAGILGARLYLAAGARGLGGCSVGAFYDSELATALGVDVEREWPLHIFAVGQGGN